ncbi:MAG: HAD-IA family hydrolase [bacterium]|nr:HAD-IA family hydrolase [bacterium]
MAMSIDEVGLGKKLQQARQAANMTQQQLSQAADLSYSTLAKIERGAIKSPSVFTIQRLSECLNTSLDSLLGIKSVVQTPEKQRLKFLYLDINGCLVGFFHRAFGYLADEAGVPSDQIESAFWHYNDAVCRGEMTVEEFNKILAQLTGKPDLNWLDYYLRAIEPIKGMAELVEWASSRVGVGLLSNIMPGYIEAMIQNGSIPAANYAAVVDSSEVGAIKPEPKIYELAQGLADVEPSEILFVDDSRANLMAAEHLGWKVMWFDDYNPEESIARIKQVLS